VKVYLASAYQTRPVIKGFAEELDCIGMQCTSRWLDETVEIAPGTTGPATDLEEGQVRGHVLDDFEDIRSADVLVLFTESVTGEKGGGGRHVETGYALAKGKKVIVVGDPENVFHRGAPQCTVVPNWHEAVLMLVSFREREPRAVSA
jgi:hypothetical protein